MRFLNDQEWQKKEEITLLNLGRKRVPFFEKKGWNDYALYVKYMKIINCFGDYFHIHVHPYFDTFTKVGSTGVHIVDLPPSRYSTLVIFYIGEHPPGRSTI